MVRPSVGDRGHPPSRGFLAALLCVHIAVQLYAGRLNLYVAPLAWSEATKETDPGLFWAFLLAELISMVALLAQVVL